MDAGQLVIRAQIQYRDYLCCGASGGTRVQYLVLAAFLALALHVRCKRFTLESV